MKNVLLISTSLHTQGGISTMIKNWLSSPLKEKYNFSHLASHKNGSKLIKIYFLISSYLIFPLILLTKRIDLIHINGSMKTSFLRKSYFLIIGKLLAKTIIYHMHSPCIDNYFAEISKLKRYLVCKFLDLYDLHFAVSHSLANDLQKWTKTPVIVIYNSVNICSSNHSALQDKDNCYILTIGDVRERKGSDDLLKVAVILKDKKVKFRLAGNGDLNKYKEMANSYGIKEKIDFLGWLDRCQLESELRKADIYFHPSYNEGLPMAVLEAISYGLPIISTSVGGIKEIVENEKNGFLFEPGDIEKFSDKINLLYEKSDLRLKMGQISKKIAQDKFNIMNIVKQIDNHYQKLLNPLTKNNN
jgi:glycosyltransferase involved in cell wall biosynthesis